MIQVSSKTAAVKMLKKRVFEFMDSPGGFIYRGGLK
jgi:hypothetical protein